MKKTILIITVILVGLLSSCRSTLNNKDNEAPTITVNEHVTEYYLNEAIPQFSATCEDDVDETCTVQTPNYPDLSKVGTHTITFQARDKAGNVTLETITVTAIDRSSYITIDVAEYETVVEVGTHYNIPNATCISTQSPTCNITLPDPIDTTIPNEAYTYDIIGTDDQGNSKSVTITIKVEDTIAPVISLVDSDSITVNHTDNWVDPGVTTTDETEVTVTSDYAPNPQDNPIGTFTITYTATDTSGNQSTITRTLIVKDVTPPVLALVGEDTLTIELGDDWVDEGLTINDVQTTTTEVSISPKHPGELGIKVIGTYTVTYTVTDASDNVSTITRTLVVEDTTDPVIVLTSPVSQTIELGVDFPSIELSTIDETANMTVENVMTPLYEGEPGTYVTTITATDESGNFAVETVTVIVQDTTPPTITLEGDAVVNLNVNDPWTDPGVTFTDLQDVVLSQDITPDVTIAGQYVITYTVEDESGNTNTVQRTVNVN